MLLLGQESSFEEERRALLPLSHSIPWERFVKGTITSDVWGLTDLNGLQWGSPAFMVLSNNSNMQPGFRTLT